MRGAAQASAFAPTPHRQVGQVAQAQLGGAQSLDGVSEGVVVGGEQGEGAGAHQGRGQASLRGRVGGQRAGPVRNGAAREAGYVAWRAGDIAESQEAPQRGCSTWRIGNSPEKSWQGMAARNDKRQGWLGPCDEGP